MLFTKMGYYLFNKAEKVRRWGGTDYLWERGNFGQMNPMVHLRKFAVSGYGREAFQNFGPSALQLCVTNLEMPGRLQNFLDFVGQLGGASKRERMAHSLGKKYHFLPPYY